MLKQAGVYVSESIFETIQLKVMRVIMRREEWTQRDLTRATRFLKPRERTEVLQTLVESGEIEVEDRETGGRPVRIFRAKGTT
jgi:metal-dependent hydrolase (beta-lactamase superfamily II)